MIVLAGIITNLMGKMTNRLITVIENKPLADNLY
jgi:hypothetical protein